ncbi:MAG: lamin tail domain-containing protein, partial [Bacteroidales bacterium]|nr:lamin tail domain-containing protein [Bacteroidales bacterium]
MKPVYIFFSFCLIALVIFSHITVNSQVVINEYSCSNLASTIDNYGQYEDWFELYNAGTASVDLGGYYLSDNPNDSLKWQFPEGNLIQAGGFMKIWTTGRNEVSGNNYHTNFRLTQTKDNPEHIILSNQSGIAVDEVELVITQKEHSRGRTTNGSENWSIFTNPTPGNSNNSATPYTSYAAKPVVSDTAAFYNSPIQITITTSEPNSQIRYTTNGSEPTTSASIYNDPVDINSTAILIARTFSNDPDVLPSMLEFNTYFINENHTMAIMSTSAEQLDNLLNGNQSLRPFGTFEYFNKDGIRTSIGYGEFNEHGQDSWVHDQRSIDYISRDECGYSYAIREELIPLTDRDEFQRIILRAAGDANYPGIDTSALLRDFFVQNSSERSGLNLDVRKGEKGLLYVNGTFWGIYGYREKVNDHDFTNYYYDQGKYDIY